LKNAASKDAFEGSGLILLADDDEMVLDIGARFLKRFGYTVLEAKDGREAIEIYEANRQRTALVILDMTMPDIDGGQTYDLLKIINPNVKVLLSSGYNMNSRAEEILARGCNGFIQKPFGMKELHEAVRQVIEGE
jgi:CheY-like chemotaxis protein